MMSVLVGILLLLANGQTVNFFSLNQDIEIGSASEKEARQTLALIANPSVTQYVTTIGQRIARNRTLPALHYQFQIVNSKDINSIGFPGGAVYIYRGLLETASNDDEIAAILAHEVSHVASRHGTVQLSRQLLVQAPIAIAAGLPATEVWKEQITKLGISLGIDAPVLPATIDLKQGVLAVPADIHEAGWWADGATPHSPVGSIVIAGHVDSATGGAGAFFPLKQARAGEIVALTSANGRTKSYRVVSVDHMLKANLPADIWSQQTPNRLVVVTCGGPFDPVTKHYRDNIVLTAVPA